MENIYYKLRTGRYVSSYDLRQAYEITTGKACGDHDKLDPATLEFHTVYDAEYSKWVFDLLGDTIVSTYTAQELNVEELVADGRRLFAISVYRQQNGCGVAEARKAVDKIAENMV